MSTPSDQFSGRSYPVEENISAQRKIWRFERYGWYFLALLLLLTLLGLFAEGPLSETQANAGGGLNITYERFERHGAATQMTVTISGRKPGEIVQVILNSELVRRHVLETITPEPMEAHSDNGGLRLSLQADHNGNAEIHIALRPNKSGITRGTISMDDNTARLTQLVYP